MTNVEYVPRLRREVRYERTVHSMRAVWIGVLPIECDTGRHKAVQLTRVMNSKTKGIIYDAMWEARKRGHPLSPA